MAHRVVRASFFRRTGPDVPADLYATLGVGRNAGEDEITKAYRKLARQYHPDRNPGDKQAEAKFKEISSAYEVLNDKTKRAQYDQFGSVGGPAGFPNGGPGAPGGFNFGGGGGPGFQNIDPETAERLFSQFFGGGGSTGGFDVGDLFGGRTSSRGKRTR